MLIITFSLAYSLATELTLLNKDNVCELRHRDIVFLPFKKFLGEGLAKLGLCCHLFAACLKMSKNLALISVTLLNIIQGG